MAEKAPEASKSFDAYEVIGVITPGTVVALLLAMEWPGLRGLLGEKGLSVGDLGLFVLLAFVLGQLIQAVGILIEPFVWPIGGRPTNWVREPAQSLVTASQRDALEAAVAIMEGSAHDIAKVSRQAWHAITTRAYGRLRSAGKSGRVDAQNRTYGMCRGLAAALLLALGWSVYTHPSVAQQVVLLAGLVAAVLRMRRAGVHYARALILDFIDLPVEKTAR